MRPARIAVLFMLTVLSGCAAHLNGTNQLYFAQNYLPLPAGCQKEPGACGPRDAANPEIPETGACVAGALVRYPVQTTQRRFLTVMPGMTLGFQQSTYHSNAHDALPVLTDWQWTVPSTLSCSSGTQLVPKWQRKDVLAVRHLMSAGLAKYAPYDQGIDYFQKAVSRACPAVGSAGTDCFETGFLNRFARGLRFDFRQLRYGAAANGKIPADVLADADQDLLTQIQASKAGLGAWYASTATLRRADTFDAAGAPLVARCSGTLVEKPAEDVPVCAFSYAALVWSGNEQDQVFPGASTDFDLILATTGDPLFMFRPRLWRWPLDVSNGKRCGESQPCKPEDMAAQGFADLSVTIPVRIAGKPDPLSVTVTSTVADFEKSHGIVVAAIERDRAWFPVRLKVRDKEQAIESSLLANESGRIRLIFHQDLRHPTLWRDVIAEGLANDVLLAPGDVIVAASR